MLGVGAMWGALWGVIGAAIGLVVGVVNPSAWVYNPVAVWAMGIGAYGAISGLGFAALLSLGEGSKLLRELSLRRVAFWGVLGSAAVPLLFGALGFFDAGIGLWDILGAVGLTGTLGGTFASGSVAIARRAELAQPDDLSLLE